MLARIPANAQGEPNGPTQVTWRLGEALRGLPVLAGHYGLPLTEAAQGLDIEGIAAIGTNLLFGLRAPSLNEHATILIADAEELFREGGNPPAVRQVRLKLGAHVGIRHLAALDDGRLLVLTGASQEQQQPAPQHILLVSPNNQNVWEIDRALLEAAPIDSAEGLAVLSQ